MNLINSGLLASVELLILILIGTPFWLLPLIALISILRGDFEDSTTKLIWVLVTLLLPIVGPILYFILGRNQRVKTNSSVTLN